MYDSPKVSIIMPVYHSAKLIKRALDSIHAQSYQNFELIVCIDDVYYDNVLDVLDAHPINVKHEILFSVTKDKSNPATARNRGIGIAHGEYIAFCDADDWWDTEKLGLQIQYLDTHPLVDLVYTLAEWHFDDGHSEFHGVPYGSRNIKWLCIAPHSSVVLRRHVCREYQFNTNLRAADDYRWLLDMHKAGIKFASINRPLTHMLIHANNLTTGRADFIVQTMKVHAAGGEYGLALLKYTLGIVLFVKRAVFRKLKLQSEGMSA
jgi:glycosyltransferase involved in cell wall biosynthesis